MRKFKMAFFMTLLLFPFNFLIGQNSFMDSLMLEASNLKSAEKAQYLYKVADDHYAVNFKEASLIAEKALDLASENGDDKLKYNCLLLLGDLSLRLQEFESADSLFNAALEVAEKSASDEQILKAKIAISKSLAFRGDYSQSIMVLDEVIAQATASADSLILARAMMSKGVNFNNISAYEAALEYYLKALKIFENHEDQYRVGILHNNLGMTFLSLGRLDEALDQFQKSLQISEQQTDLEGVTTSTLNIGVVYQKMGKLHEARENYRQALKMAQNQGALDDVALLTANLGTTAMLMGKHEQARVYLERAILMRDSIGNRHKQAHSLNSLAEVHRRLENYPLALSKASEAENLSRETRDLDQLSEALRLKAILYESQGNYPLAYRFLSEHKNLSDSIFSLKSDEAISNLNIRYETAQKENEIAQLAAENIKSKRERSIFLGAAILITISALSLIYALYTRRNRDKLLLAKEHELHERQNKFFANISHEFRTPLSLILGPVHNLKQKSSNPQENALLKIIQQNAERLLFLINQILDLTKFDKEVVALKKEIFSVNMMVQGICSSFNSLADDRKIRYSCQIDQEGLYLFADRRRLEIVLINLLSNAFKFTPQHGSISVDLKTEIEQKKLWISVADSGAGIPEGNLHKIFDRYYFDDGADHSGYEGAGIGLALSKHIVELHGGTISVSSKLQEGSKFLVSLPYDPELSIHSETEGMAQEEIANTPLSLSEASPEDKETSPILLLVEDGKEMREYIKYLLHGHYQIIEAADASEGWEKAIEHTPDVVVSDVMMPGSVNGLEFCSQLKSDIRTSHIPVLLLTAKASAEDRISGLGTEADVYLTKPFIPEELALNLRNMIASRKKAQAVFQQHRKIEPAKMAFNSIDEQFLEAVSRELEKHYPDEHFSVEELSGLLNLSRSQLHRKVKSLTGESPSQLIRTYRLSRARDMVSSHAATIAEISYAVGFSSPAYFSKCFLEEYKLTPSEMRSRAEEKQA